MNLTKVYRTILTEQNAASVGWKVGKTTLQAALQDLNVYVDFVGDPLSAQDSDLQSNANWINYETQYKNKVMQLYNASRKYLNQIINNPQVLDKLASTIRKQSDGYDPNAIHTKQGRFELDKMYENQIKTWKWVLNVLSK